MKSKVNEFFGIVLILIILSFFIIFIMVFVGSFVRKDKITNFCKERGFDNFEVVKYNVSRSYFNCCKKEVRINVVNNFYVAEKECIAGGIMPKFWSKVVGELE